MKAQPAGGMATESQAGKSNETTNPLKFSYRKQENQKHNKSNDLLSANTSAYGEYCLSCGFF